MTEAQLTNLLVSSRFSDDPRVHHDEIRAEFRRLNKAIDELRSERLSQAFQPLNPTRV